jgi:DNA polymerase IIIc chi subunit
LLWAFIIKPPITSETSGRPTEARVDISDAAFEPTAFRAPKPYKVRFVPRNDSQLELVREQWKQARVEGYKLRGLDVNVEGVV